MTNPAFDFAGALLRAGMKDRKALASTLLTPVFMLMTFWLVGRTTDRGNDLLTFIFPGIVGFTAMMAGLTQATRIVGWRQQGVFRRLACTPVPLGRLVTAASLTQVLLGVAQAMLVLLFGVVALRVPVDGPGALAAIGVLALGAACFVAFGSIMAGLAHKVETVNLLFVFTLMPMGFLGNTFLPAEMMPPLVQRVGPWLPTQMLSDLIRPLLNGGAPPAHPWLPVLGLAAYTLAFTAIARRVVRWN